MMFAELDGVQLVGIPKKIPITQEVYNWVFPKISYPQIIHCNGFSIINHPFWGTPIFGNTQLTFQKVYNIWPSFQLIEVSRSNHSCAKVDKKVWSEMGDKISSGSSGL